MSSSTDQGATYTSHLVANASSQLLDKNHMWIDNSPTSPYTNILYDAWTDFSNNNIAISSSTNSGVNWSSAVNISSAVNAGSHCQGGEYYYRAKW